MLTKKGERETLQQTFVDYNSVVPPLYQPAQPLLPSFHLPKKGSKTIQITSTKVCRRVSRSQVKIEVPRKRLRGLRGLLDMMSALEGEGGHGKADVVKEGGVTLIV